MDAGDTARDGMPVLTTLFEIAGTRRCSQAQCSSRHGVGCEYVDRRSRGCATAWCPEHRVVLDGSILCRRHAAVVGALPARASGKLPPPPDVDSRAPSLAGWVARALDTEVRAVIAAGLRIEPEEVRSAAVVLSLVGPDRRRAWERGWHAANAAGAELRVTVVVEEGADGEVAMCVDGVECARLRPPWIVSRDVGPTDPRRAEFNTALTQALQARLGGAAA